MVSSLEMVLECLIFSEMKLLEINPVRTLDTLLHMITNGHYENVHIQLYRKFHLQKLKIFR